MVAEIGSLKCNDSERSSRNWHARGLSHRVCAPVHSLCHLS